MIGQPKTTFGICTAANCAAARELVELYDGPGMFCPQCGSYLQECDERRIPPQAETASPAAPAAPRPTLPPPPPATTPTPAAVPRPRKRRWLALGAVAAILGTIGLVALTGGPMHSVALAPGICASSMTGRVASDLVDGYVRTARLRTGTLAVRATDCAIQFATLDSQAPASASQRARFGRPVAFDAIVAVVNPQNPLAAVSRERLRDVLTGRATSWSVLNGRSEPIVVYVPSAGSDEAAIASSALLKGAAFGSTVVRVASTAEVVRAVAAPSGRTAIGIAAFSGSVPAKVLRLGDAPPPSALSIPSRRYPLAVSVAAELRDPRDARVAGFLRYLGSIDARTVAERDGLVGAGTR